MPVAVAHALRADGFDASEDGTGRGTPLVPIAFHGSQDPDVSGDVTHPVGRNYGQEVSVTIPFDTTQITPPENRSNPRPADPAGTLAKAGHPPAVAFDMRGRDGGAQFEGPHDTANIRAASGGSSRSYVAQQWRVRRLMPIECERLQGFPDGYTQVTYRKKPAADGPRYKGLGNSWATNVAEVIGERIAMVEADKRYAAGE